MSYEEEKENLVRQLNILIGENRALRELLGLNINKHVSKHQGVLIDFKTGRIINPAQENM